MTIKEIVLEKIRELKADGLCCEACSCCVNDLMPCGQASDDCEIAKRVPASDMYKAEWGEDTMLIPVEFAESFSAENWLPPVVERMRLAASTWADESKREILAGFAKDVEAVYFRGNK
jgi:hypothetical protein